MRFYGPVETLNELFQRQVGGAVYASTFSRLSEVEEQIRDEMFFAHEMARRELAEHGLSVQESEALGEFLETTDDSGLQRIRLRRHERYCALLVGDRQALVDATRSMIRSVFETHGSGRMWRLGDVPHMVADDERIACIVLPTDDGAAPHFVLRLFYCHENAREP
jgi:hypothetical protein